MLRTETEKRRAPGPKGSLLGKLSEFQRDPLQLFLSMQRDYGEIVRVRLGPYIIHQITDPEHIQYVLQDNNTNYIRGKLYENFKLFFGDGLLTTDGDTWLKHRRVAQPFFHRHVLNAIATTITDAATMMIERWSELERQQQSFDLVVEMMELSLSVLSKMMFSVDISRYAETIGPAVRFALKAMMLTGSLDEMIPQWIPTSYNRALTQAQKTLHAEIDRIIESHRGELKESKDLVTLFLSMQEEQKVEARWTHKEIHDELMTIFLAGHETTGSGLAWTLYCLAQNPEVYRKLDEELEQVLGGRIPTVEDFPKLTYLRQVVDESLRMYPPIWLYPRDALKDDEIGGYHIPAKTTVLLTPYASHRNPNYWEKPEVFDPERFTPEHVASRPRYAYFPFGGGQRQCIGNHLALLQLQLITAQVVQHYRLQVVPGHPVVCGSLVSLRPLNGIPVTLQRRERVWPKETVS